MVRLGVDGEAVVLHVELGYVICAVCVPEQQQVPRRSVLGAIRQAHDVVAVRLHRDGPAPRQFHRAYAVGLGDLHRPGLQRTARAIAQKQVPSGRVNDRQVLRLRS